MLQGEKLTRNLFVSPLMDQNWFQLRIHYVDVLPANRHLFIIYLFMLIDRPRPCTCELAFFFHPAIWKMLDIRHGTAKNKSKNTKKKIEQEQKEQEYDDDDGKTEEREVGVYRTYQA